MVHVALSILPKNIRILDQLGSLFLYQKQYDKAIKIADQILDIDSSNEGAFAGKIYALAGLLRFNEAEFSAKEALEKLPDSIKILIQTAGLYYDQEKYENTVEVASKIHELDPENEPAFAWKITSLRKLKKLDEAESEAKEALKKLPDSIEILHQLGELYFERENYIECIEILNHILSLDPENEKGLQGKIASLVKLDKFDEAESAAKEALKKLPNSIGIWLQLCGLYFNQEKYEETVEASNSILKLDPENETALAWKVASLTKLLRFAESETLAKQSLVKKPDSIYILNQLGELYFYQDKYQEFIDALNKIPNFDIEKEKVIVWRIASLIKLLRFTEAETLAKQSLTKMPNSIDILNQVGVLYFSQNKYQELIDELNKIPGLDPKSEAVLAWNIYSRIQRHEFAEAEILAKDALRLIPNSTLLLNYLAYLYFVWNKYEKTVYLADQILKLDSKNETALTGKIVSLGKLLKFPEAETFARYALIKLPYNISILFQLADLCIYQNKLDEALAFSIQAANTDPNNIEAKLRHAQTLIRLNKCNEALEIFRNLTNIYSNNFKVIDRLGYFYIHCNNLIDAEKQFKFILNHEPNNISGLNGIGLVCLNSSRYKDAEERFRKALDQNKYDTDIIINLARSLIRQEIDGVYKQGPIENASVQTAQPISQFDEAEDLCTSVLDLFPNNPDALGCMGTIKFQRGQTFEAENYLRRSIAIDPINGKYADLGALQSIMGKLDEAEKNLKRAIKINQYDVKAHIELGNIFLQTENLKGAITEFRQAASSDPNSEDAIRALATALMRVGDYIESEKILRKAIRNLDESQRWRLHLTLSRLLIQMGENTKTKEFHEDALAQAKKAIKIRPDHPDPYFHAGIAQYKLRDFWNAKKSFESCLNRDEHYFEAERNIRIINPLISPLLMDPSKTAKGGLFLELISVLLLIITWASYLYSEKDVSDTVLIAMNMASLGLIVIGFLLPTLAKLQLPGGFIAELSQTKETISSGPTGEIGFSTSFGSGTETGQSGSLTISKGPGV
ncbi:MAG: tetratricopeptide repeat protein [Methanothrix sp.]